MSRTWEEISSIVQARRRQDSPLIQAMQTTRAHFYSDVIIPMPDVVGSPELPPLMPQLIHDGIENSAMQACGPTADIECPAVKPNDEKSRMRADQRRKVYHGRWHESALRLLLGRAYRQLCGYGTCHFLVLPCWERGGARIETRDPLSAYPEMRHADDIRNPLNVAYVYGRSYDWLYRNYPEAREWLTRTSGEYTDSLWDTCEWIDEDDIVMGILGPREIYNNVTDNWAGIELRRYKNLAGMVPAASPRRLTLDRVAGQLDQMVGIVDWMARLMALDIVAAERSVFPDMVGLGDEGRPPELVGGEWKDGRTGEVNLVSNIRDWKVIHSEPGPMTGMMLDRLERAGRHSGGVNAINAGEFTGSIRSGRVVDQMAAFSIDPRIAELQEIMGFTLSTLNDAIGNVEKGYFPNAKITLFSGWAGDRGHVEYKPTEIFDESTASVVSYAMPGADISRQTVAVAQMTGSDLSSKRTARRMHPYIDDPDAEEAQIEIERLESTALLATQQQAAQGTLPLADLAQIIKYRKEGMTFMDALVQAQEDAQTRQAQEAPPPEPGQAVAPETQPGLSLPGLGIESQTPEGSVAIARPNQSLDNLDHLLETLRGGP